MDIKTHITLYLLLFITITASSNGYNGNKVDQDSSLFAGEVISGELANGLQYYIKPLDSVDRIHMELFIEVGTVNETKGEQELAHFIEHIPIGQFKIQNLKNENGYNFSSQHGLKLGGHVGLHYTNYSFSFPAITNGFSNKGLEYLAEISKGKIVLDSNFINSEKAILFEEIINRSDINGGPFQMQQIEANFFECKNNPIAPDSLWNHIQTFTVPRVKKFIDEYYTPLSSTIIIVGNIKNPLKLESEIIRTFSSPQARKKMKVLQECSEIDTKDQSKFLVLNNLSQDLTNRKEVIFYFFHRSPKVIDHLNNLQIDFIEQLIPGIINDVIMNTPRDYSQRFSLSATNSEQFYTNFIKLRTEMGNERSSIELMQKLLYKLESNGIDSLHWATLQRRGDKMLIPKSNNTISYWRNSLKDIISSKRFNNKIDQNTLEEWWSALKLNDFNKLLKKSISTLPDDIAVIAPLNSIHDSIYWKTSTQLWLNEAISTKMESKKSFSKLDNIPFQLEYDEQAPDRFDNRVFILSNGIKIIFHSKKDIVASEILKIHGFKKIKMAHRTPQEKAEIIIAPLVIRNAGIFDMDKYALENVLQKNNLSYLYPYATESEIGIKARGNINDLDNFFKSLYGYINSPRVDSLAFKDWQYQEWQRFLHPPINRSISDFEIAVLSELSIPHQDIAISDRYMASTSVVMDSIYNIYNSLYGNAKYWTFLISTTKNADEVIPIINRYFKYIPSKPSQNKECQQESINTKLPLSRISKTIYLSSIPKDNTILSLNYLSSYQKDDRKLEIQFDILKEIISRRIKNLRYTKRRAIYDSSIGSNKIKYNSIFRIAITIPTREEEIEFIKTDITEILKEVKTIGIDETELENIITDYIKPKYQHILNNEEVQMNDLYDFYRYGTTPISKSNLKSFLTHLDAEMIRQAANKIFTSEHLFEFIGKNPLK